MERKNKQLKIAMLGHKRIPSREGGIEIVVEELATRMAALGHDVTCYNRKGHHVSGQEFDANINDGTYKDVKIKAVFTIDKKGLAAMTSSLVAALKVAFSKFDIVHFHAEGPCAMMWIPKMLGKRCIATIHGLDWTRPKWTGFAKGYIRFGEKIAARFADEIIVLNKDNQRYFLDTYNRKTILIPNGVDKPKIIEAKEIIDKFGLEKDSYILFLGRLVPGKGLEYLINSFENMDTDKKLVIAGGASDTDEYMSELKGLAENNSRIIFTGFVQGTLLEELYSNAYIYTLPSDSEGMPLSLLEAMSYGNCVLGSDISEIAEVVEDKAVLFKKSDVKDLQEQLQRLFDNNDLVKSYKDTAIEFICDKYNWDDVVDRTLNAYK